MFLLILASILIGILGLWYYKFFHYYGYLKKIPAPTVWPVLGNAIEFHDNDAFLINLERNFRQLNTKTLRIHLPTQTVIMTKEYKLIEYILGSQQLINKGFEYDFFLNWLGLSVFTSSGQQWRSKRKMLTPTFHFQILEQFHDVFNKNGAVLVNKLKKQIGTPGFDVYPYSTLCTLDVICETAMGTSVNAQLEEDSAYVKAISVMGKIVPARAVNLMYSSDFLYKFTAMYKEEQEHIAYVRNYHNNIIQNRRKKFMEEQKSKLVDIDEDDLGRKKKVPFLDLLIQTTIDGQPLSDEEIASEVATFMFAGHDTTSGTLSFALYALGNHPEVQQKCFEELKDIFGDDKERPSTLADIQEMKYLELVIKETLRMYPAAPNFTRTVLEDFTVDGITYPKGITIGIAAYGIHHDEEIYPNPEKFDPERFSRERNDGKKPFAFIPFSAGPRNCIGQKFAMLELKTLLSTILRNVEVKPASPVHKLNLVPSIVLKSTNGIKIAVAERKYK
ncbi:cytochrome P450 4c3-like [Atheta coriaria]|uniref:cytochrome P450 4c3-like n=1 Tax=Dalotia coriaria TaxID=877792 RepID=UPI0031F3B046